MGLCKKKKIVNKKKLCKVKFHARGKTNNKKCCKAAFCIRFDHKSNKWVVGEFKRERNHDLVTQFETQFLCSHRTIKDFDKA